jgi:scyllo-inositol 2-dehydrogenase (NADP+)
MRRTLSFLLAIFLVAFTASLAQRRTASGSQGAANAPLRVAVAGLVHGHAEGFFRQIKGRQDIQIVGVAEPDQQLFQRYAKRYSLDENLWHADLDELLQKVHPQAVWAYTNTFEHRKVVEVCATRGVHVIMEKPLAVSFEDARAIERAAHSGNIQVLVNYETSWYPSNHAAYDLLHQNALGPIRKVVVHDGHSGPKEIGVGAEFLTWLTDPKLNGGGALFDFGCYGADLMTWLMDGRGPDTVTAVTQQFKPDIYQRVDDEATIVLTYPQAQAILQPSWNWPFDRKDMEVYGKTGYAITVQRNQLRVRLPHAQEELRELQPLRPPENDSISYFRAVLLNGLNPDGLSSLETNVIVSQILDAARESAATRKTIHLQN